jgi:hypothetical protein
MNIFKKRESQFGDIANGYINPVFKNLTEIHQIKKHIRRKIKYFRRRIYADRLKRLSITKRKFINDLKSAIENGYGYAAGKLGVSQAYWMYYEIYKKKEKNIQRLRDFEKDLVFHGLKQVGVFPGKPDFYLKFNKFYAVHVNNIDCLGLVFQKPEMEIIRYYKLKNNFIYYPEQEPDRSIPDDERNCYLPFFSGKKILIICPFGKFLRERASKDVFEAVWAKTGKKWFYPKGIDYVEFPYGFTAEAQRKYGSALKLYEFITEMIDQKDFDIALIGAGGLAIPIASYVKNIGKIGIDLGGHLQIIFGVFGKRWKEVKEWNELYFNEHWTDLPSKYRPKETDVCDNGAYW